MAATYHILAMDGGGVRGVLTATLLERLEAAHPGFLDHVELFAGTSTGGLLALGLAAGMTPTQAREMYENYSRVVFARSLWDKILRLGNLIGAKYSNAALKKALTDQFGELTLEDLPHRVVIAAFQLDNHASQSEQRSWKPKFFHNYPGPDSDGAQKVIDVAMATAAAPTYFPVYGDYIDGGVVAGNPSMCALAQALQPATGGQVISDLALLSVSTGHNPNYLSAPNADWGLIQWAPHLVDLMLEGDAGTADYQCRQILDGAYYRLNPLLPKPVDMDGVDDIQLLRDVATQEDITAAIQWIEQYFYKI